MNRETSVAKLRPSLCATLLAAGLFLAACGHSSPVASGGGSGPGPGPAPTASPAPGFDEGAPLQSYLHDLSTRQAGVTFDNATLEHYRIPTREGSVLDGWVRRPPGIAGQALVLVVSPYYGGGDPRLSPTGDPSAALGKIFLPYGYAVGFLSVGGTGNSGGCFRDGGSIERQQLYDAVQYLGEQSWSNGKVASIGVSYDGTTANELFVNPPPALATVVPMEAISDYYRYSFNNGIRRGTNSAFTAYYYIVVGVNPLAGLEGGIGPTDPQGTVTGLSGEPCAEQLAIQQQGLQSLLSGDKIPEYWDDRDAIKLVRDTPEVARPPMLYVQGYGDLNVDTLMGVDYLDAVRDTGVPLHILSGQWDHAYPQPTGSSITAETIRQLNLPESVLEVLAEEIDLRDCSVASENCRGDFFGQLLLAWFDQWLLGKDTGILDAPMMQTQADDRVWRHETAWPPPAVRMVDLHPNADLSLGTVPGDGDASYTDNNLAVLGAGTTLEFSSAPLGQPMRLTGIPRLQVQATADKAQAELFVTLLEVAADGTRRRINFGAQSLNHVADPGHGDPDISGKPIPVDLQLFNFDNVLAAGSRLVLVIGGAIAEGNGPTPNLQPLGQGASISLDLGTATLSLPVNQMGTAERLSWIDAPTP